MKLYWVDTKISGKYEQEASEMYRETATGEEDATEFSVGGLMSKDDLMQLEGDSGEEDEDNDDEDDGASRSHRPKIDKAAEEAAMEDISIVRLQTLYLRFAHSWVPCILHLQDVENVRTVMANLLKAQGRLDATSKRLLEIGSDEASTSLCCNIPRVSQSILLAHTMQWSYRFPSFC